MSDNNDRQSLPSPDVSGDGESEWADVVEFITLMRDEMRVGHATVMAQLDRVEGQLDRIIQRYEDTMARA